MTTSDKVNRKNNKSPQRCEETPVSDHNTPVRKKQSISNTEESPDLDYCPSPILFPCTQESTEVAWDWQSSSNKTPESRNKKWNAQCETPKGTKLLQKKRNSNSPLLYKPLKKKTIKMESIDNIGQFSAELQALNEQMRHIKQNNKISSNVDVKEELEREDGKHGDEVKMVLTSRNTAEKMEQVEDQQNCIGETNDCNNSTKNNRSGSYDDLFDDSVDECMIRCTQEMEENFKLIADKENSVNSQAPTKKEPCHTNNVADKTCTNFTSKGNSKVSVKHISYKGTSNNTPLKTYSSLRRGNLDRNTSVQKDKSLYKMCLNNKDTMIHSHIQKICNNITSARNNITELFGDDSFDDCLATCVEDDKLLSSTVCDKFLTHQNNSIGEIKYKYLACMPFGKSEATSTSSLKSAIKVETPASSFENRKFFKTKSLSDHLHSTKSSTITHSSITSVSINKNPIAINEYKSKSSAVSLTHRADRTQSYNINRCTIKESDRFVRHHSTGNMKSDTEEVTKRSSQPGGCTAEEIEKKRLQATMKLEAKRKLYFMKIKNNINR